MASAHFATETAGLQEWAPKVPRLWADTVAVEMPLNDQET